MLYIVTVKRSSIRSQNLTAPAFNDGLFAEETIPKNKNIVAFCGIRSEYSDYKIRDECGWGGYYIRFNKNEGLDCFGSVLSDICLASKANSCKNAVFIEDPQTCMISVHFDGSHCKGRQKMPHLLVKMPKALSIHCLIRER